MNNAAKPAYTSPAAVNFYYGDDRDFLPNGNSNRFSYGMESGCTTIGLYQPTMLINHIFPQLRELMDLVTKAMSDKDPLHSQMLKKHPFNVVFQGRRGQKRCDLYLLLPFLSNGAGGNSNWQFGMP